MKELVAIAKQSVNDRDGFLNGFIKGVIGSAAFMVALAFLTGVAA